MTRKNVPTTSVMLSAASLVHSTDHRPDVPFTAFSTNDAPGSDAITFGSPYPANSKADSMIQPNVVMRFPAARWRLWGERDGAVSRVCTVLIGLTLSSLSQAPK